MMKEWFDEIIDACQSLANPEKAIGMKAYMKKNCGRVLSENVSILPST